MKEFRLGFSMRHPYFYDWLLNLVRKIKACRMRFKRNSKATIVSGHTGSPVDYSDASEPLILLMAIHWFAPSGAEYYALECARLARKEGFEIIWTVDFPSEDENWRQKFMDVSPHAVFLWQENSPLKAIVDCVNAVGGKVGVIHIHHSPFFYDNLKALKTLFSKANVVDTTHIIEIAGEGFPKRSLESGSAIDVRNVISYGLWNYFIEHGVASSSLYRSAIVPEDIERCENLNFSFFTIGIIGRLSQQKRLYLLPVFLKQLDNVLVSKNFKSRVRFFIYGYGPYAKYLERSFFLEHISVFVKEHCYNRDQIYMNLDCVLQLSENEGVSIVSYEAASYGIPFVATNVGQQHEMVHPDFLVPAQPRQAVKKAAELVAALAVTPERYTHVVKWQYDRLNALHQEYGYKKQMRQLYRELIR